MLFIDNKTKEFERKVSEALSSGNYPNGGKVCKTLEEAKLLKRVKNKEGFLCHVTCIIDYFSEDVVFTGKETVIRPYAKPLVLGYLVTVKERRPKNEKKTKRSSY